MENAATAFAKLRLRLWELRWKLDFHLRRLVLRVGKRLIAWAERGPGVIDTPARDRYYRPMRRNRR